MIVYADREEEIETRPALEHLIGRIGQDDAVSVLIRYGQLESGIADALQPEVDDWNKTIEELRFAAILLAMAAGHRGCEFDYDFRRLLTLDLPDRIRVRPPEGFAFYAVYPEQYRNAATRFVEELQPRRCGIIGIRSIGATLSAIVAEAVFSDQCDVFTYTLRPRGHPFDRHVQLTPDATEAIRNAAADYYLVVDEGPGISGSSFASVCRFLEEELGVAPDKVLLFPSWDAPSDVLRSEAARKYWSTHRKYTATFEETCLPALKAESVVDISGGAWRRYLYDSEEEYPAVNPRHERRKYVALQGSTQLLYKFAGLGEFGRERFRRAQLLAKAGFMPAVHDFRNGFLVRLFEKGHPLTRKDLNEDLLSRMAEYLAFVQESFPVSLEPAALEPMVRVNVSEGLGEPWLEKINFDRLREATSGSDVTAIDGRMLPHEWIGRAQGYCKTDAVDHYDDHFFPGSRSIAWDIAGTFIEWQMPEDVRARLLRKFLERTQSPDIREQLPYVELSYLAYRLGYATMAMETLGHDPAEVARFERLRDEYATALKDRIETL